MLFASKRILVAIVLVAMLLGSCPLAFAGTTGIISGTVTDSKSGAKLSGVNVAIKGTNLTTVTDTNGYFVITNVAPGSYVVTASLVGYADLENTDLQVTMDVTSSSNFKLETKDIVENTATVKVARPLLQADVTNTLNLVPARVEQMIKSQPNSLYQVQGIVNTQPGVTPGPDGMPHLRGGRSTEIGYQIDGISVVEPLSNNFGTNVVTVGMSKMQIYTGGYRAEFGPAISGVLNEIKKTGSDSPGGSTEFTNGDQSYKGSYIQYGGVSPSGLDYYVGSYLWESTFEKMFYRGTNSADAVGKFVYPKGNDKWTLLMNQGVAKYYFDSIHDFTFMNEPVRPEADHTHQAYRLLGLTWSHNFSPASFVTVRPYMFRTASVMDALAPDGPLGTYLDYGTDQKGLQVEYTSQLNENHLFKAGTSFIGSKNRYMAWIPNLGEAFGFPEWGDYYYNSDVNTLQSGAFIQDQAKIGKKWNVDAGIRYDRMNFNKVQNPDIADSQVSPRFGLSYSVNNKNVIKSSWGRFIQFPPSYVMERVYANPDWNNYRLGTLDLKPERSVSWDLSWEHQLNSNSMFRITPFYKTYSDLLQSRRVDPENPDSMASMYINSGQGKSTGIEGYYSKRLSNNWEGFVSYTWMRSRANASDFTSSIDPGVWVYTDWDQRHTLNIVASYKKDKWEHNFQFTFGSGLADSVDSSTASLQKHGSAAAVLSWNINRKLPKGSTLGDQVYLNIWNIFNTGKATHYYTYMYPNGDPSDPGTEWLFAREPDSWVVPRFITLGVSKKF